MTTYLSVVPGIDMTRALNNARLTKKWLRDYLRANPEKDFFILHPRTAVNGEDCIREGNIVLEVRDPKTMNLAGMVSFQSTTEPGPSGFRYQAVVS